TEGPATCWSSTPPCSARCTAATRAWRISGRTLPADNELELNDIQSGVLRPRPSPYAATYILIRIDDQRSGRELMRRLAGGVAPATHTTSPAAAAPWAALS